MKKNRRDGRDREAPSAWLREVFVQASVKVGTSLRDLVIEGGLKVFSELLEEDLRELCGARHERHVGRRGYRHGSEEVGITFGGRQIVLRKPRARSLENRELHMPTWEALSREDLLSERVVEQILSGVTTRRYERSLEEMPAEVEVRGTSRSSVSRRFIARTKAQVKAFLSRPLDDEDYVVVFIDGKGLGDHVVLTALGVTRNGEKRVLGCVEGSTENETAGKSLLRGLVDRGLRVDRHRLFVIDGAKALRKAIKAIFSRWGHVQRCQVHKERNVLGHLPDEKHAWVRRQLRDAWAAETAEAAQKALRRLARLLEDSHPCAAASLREGLEETLTVLRLGARGAILRTLRSTNPIENLQGSVKRVTRNVTRWRSGSMVLRWTVTALIEAERRFRRVKGHRDLAALVAALEHLEPDSSLDAAPEAA